MTIQHFVLFNNHTSGMALYNRLKAQGIQTIIAPTPRRLSKCCGISLLVKERDIEAVRSFIKENNIEIKDIAAIESSYDINRNKFC